MKILSLTVLQTTEYITISQDDVQEIKQRNGVLPFIDVIHTNGNIESFPADQCSVVWKKQ